MVPCMPLLDRYRVNYDDGDREDRTVVQVEKEMVLVPPEGERLRGLR